MDDKYLVRDAFVDREVAAEEKVDFGTINEGKLREFAFVGRSNVGKSSLINCILGQDLMDANKKPGKTKKLHYVNLPHSNIYLVDCPGYGYAKVSVKEKQSWQKLMTNYIQNSITLRRMVN